ncbi:MAG: DUF4920 domain-containing protein [Acidobacteria bacterium]|nr:DUF4920 domain-containing protein [Acidobacteriota bacterium]
MKKILLATFLATLAASGADAAAAAPEKFGAPLTGKPEAVTLAQLVKEPAKFSGKSLRTEGKVNAVCTQKGCWMTMNEGDQTVRITFKDYAFFVPKDIAGAKAVVEGSFKVEEIPEGTAKHYAEETPGGKPDAIKGPQKQLSFEATGVEITRAAK